MKKELSEMTLEQLWQLFPVFLVPPNSGWEFDYNEMQTYLADILFHCAVERISHIGSTAIHGIWSKNIVDVLVEVCADANIEYAANTIVKHGFIQMSAKPNRFSFNRGYTKDGFADKVYHIHLRYAGDHDELYFRDYLNDHPQVAKEYETMKLKLWKRYPHHRDAYTDAKTEFICKWTAEAKRAYPGRYE